MSCEVASSPFPDPGFASPFNVDNAHGEKVDYAVLGDFNYSFGPADHSCVDPQNLSNAGSPSGHFDPVLTPDFTPDNYPADFGAVPAAPYFQSVEQPFSAPTLPLHLQNQHLHRRSVSEPPEGALVHHHRPPHPDAPMTFHRDGQLLNVARAVRPSVKRAKQSRAQPYQRSPRQPPPMQNRYQLRRTHTQPTHLPPTSVPHGLPVDHPLQQQQMHHMPFEQIPREPQYVSSRVCTPAPEAIDPFLGASPMPAVGPMGDHSRAGFEGHHNNIPVPESVMIKMGVEELRSLITEVVQKAIEGLQPDKSVAAIDLVAQELQVGEAVGSVLDDRSVVDAKTAAEYGASDGVVTATSPAGEVVDLQLDTGLMET
jgi:hypothetical protein